MFSQKKSKPLQNGRLSFWIHMEDFNFWFFGYSNSVSMNDIFSWFNMLSFRTWLGSHLRVKHVSFCFKGINTNPIIQFIKVRLAFKFKQSTKFSDLDLHNFHSRIEKLWSLNILSFQFTPPHSKEKLKIITSFLLKFRTGWWIRFENF